MSLLLALTGGGGGPSPQTWVGVGATVTVTATTGSFTGTPATWVGVGATITITAATGSFSGGSPVTPVSGGGAARPRMRYERVPKPDYEEENDELAAILLAVLELV
jgi:hypothetical protein